ncbi:hypothetical protein [Gramella sp. KN1008]|uniref:hypothetical protein n=1 Tax=Gramella sp. KN1008 TaxID=2529298 RepID=UPI00103E96D6|nr:hypothetical protein [Gramella sp. KN1008]TBW28272.1 hypothetical protein EZJ28_05865 [Gramella sp. KN1008]
MRELVKLNQLVIERLSLNILYNTHGECFLWNGIWVTELGKEYFDYKIREIEVYIKDHIDYSKGVEVGFLNRIREKLASTFQELEDIQENFILESSYTIDSEYRGFPEQGVMYFPGELPYEYDSMQSVVLDILKEYHDIELEDTINTAEEMAEVLSQGKFEGGEKLKKEEIKMFFAKAHLIYVLRLHQYAISQLLNYIKNYFETVDGLAKDYFIENKYVDIPTSNPFEIEFNLSKEEIAILYYNLMEGEIVKTPGNTGFKREANLKSYLESSNIFFRKKGKRTRLVGIKNEFNKVKNDREVHNMDSKEVNLLKRLITLFNERIQEIEA